MMNAQGGIEEAQAGCAWPLPYDVSKAHVSCRVCGSGCCDGGVVSVSA